jgi:hypothetical protein
VKWGWKGIQNKCHHPTESHIIYTCPKYNKLTLLAF